MKFNCKNIWVWKKPTIVGLAFACSDLITSCLPFVNKTWSESGPHATPYTVLPLVDIRWEMEKLIKNWNINVIQGKKCILLSNSGSWQLLTVLCQGWPQHSTSWPNFYLTILTRLNVVNILNLIHQKDNLTSSYIITLQNFKYTSYGIILHF